MKILFLPLLLAAAEPSPASSSPLPGTLPLAEQAWQEASGALAADAETLRLLEDLRRLARRPTGAAPELPAVRRDVDALLKLKNPEPVLQAAIVTFACEAYDGPEFLQGCDGSAETLFLRRREDGEDLQRQARLLKLAESLKKPDQLGEALAYSFSLARWRLSAPFDFPTRHVSIPTQKESVSCAWRQLQRLCARLPAKASEAEVDACGQAMIDFIDACRKSNINAAELAALKSQKAVIAHPGLAKMLSCLGACLLGAPELRKPDPELERLAQQPHPPRGTAYLRFLRAAAVDPRRPVLDPETPADQLQMPEVERCFEEMVKSHPGERLPYQLYLQHLCKDDDRKRRFQSLVMLIQAMNDKKLHHSAVLPEAFFLTLDMMQGPEQMLERQNPNIGLLQWSDFNRRKKVDEYTKEFMLKMVDGFDRVRHEMEVEGRKFTISPLQIRNRLIAAHCQFGDLNAVPSLLGDDDPETVFADADMMPSVDRQTLASILLKSTRFADLDDRLLDRVSWASESDLPNDEEELTELLGLIDEAAKEAPSAFLRRHFAMWRQICQLRKSFLKGEQISLPLGDASFWAVPTGSSVRHEANSLILCRARQGDCCAAIAKLKIEAPYQIEMVTETLFNHSGGKTLGAGLLLGNPDAKKRLGDYLEPCCLFMDAPQGKIGKTWEYSREPALTKLPKKMPVKINVWPGSWDLSPGDHSRVYSGSYRSGEAIVKSDAYDGPNLVGWFGCGMSCGEAIGMVRVISMKVRRIHSLPALGPNPTLAEKLKYWRVRCELASTPANTLEFAKLLSESHQDKECLELIRPLLGADYDCHHLAAISSCRLQLYPEAVKLGRRGLDLLHALPMSSSRTLGAYCVFARAKDPASKDLEELLEEAQILIDKPLPELRCLGFRAVAAIAGRRGDKKQTLENLRRGIACCQDAEDLKQLQAELQALTGGS